MKAAIRARLEALGRELSPAMIAGTRDVVLPLVPARDATVQITRDLHYGPDDRNRLDVFHQGRPVRAPVLVYVHGGGFVTGDKTSPGSPFYDNIGQWAARRGWIGVTLTYRLAPAHRWPCGPADMALAVAWLRANIAGYGGDRQNIFLVGQSAGAAHVAAYVAHDRFHRGGVGIAGAVMMSGLFDLTSQTSNPYIDAYFGGDYQAVADAASIAGLLATPLPLLFTVSELDPAAFQDQAAMLVHAWHGQKHELPRLAYLAGHNHISPGLCLGTAEDQLARCIAQFVDTFGAAAAAADLNPKAMAHQPKA